MVRFWGVGSGNPDAPLRGDLNFRVNKSHYSVFERSMPSDLIPRVHDGSRCTKARQNIQLEPRCNQNRKGSLGAAPIAAVKGAMTPRPASLQPWLAVTGRLAPAYT